MPSDEGYRKLLPYPSEDGEGDLPQESVLAKDRGCIRHRTWILITLLQTIIIFTLIAWLWGSRPFRETTLKGQLWYSPAESAIAYETGLFEDGITQTIYIDEPSDAVDQAWDALYHDWMLSRVDRTQAQLLPNATLRIPGDEEHHVIALSVFHQMHCLNVVRKALRPEHYIDPITGNLGHIQKEDVLAHVDHCVDVVRQGIMCASDVSPIVFQWSEKKQRSVANMRVPHSCRNYDAIRDWAREHVLQVPYNPFVLVE